MGRTHLSKVNRPRHLATKESTGKIYFARTYKEPLDVGTCALVRQRWGESQNPGMVRDLAGTVSGSGAQMGLLITRVRPD